MACLDDTGLAQFVEGKLSAEDVAATERHLGTCDSCRALIGELLASVPAAAAKGTGPTERSSAPAVASGAMIDRYVTVSELGFGAMGRVYLAIDPELDRRVAIKVLRAANGDADRDLRLRREAQALARVTHPNVATVFDVGEVDGKLFIAMEHVGGGTLAAWLSATMRPWADVVRVFAAAGRGLAAVHARGLVHRDFKPDNVLLDDGGDAKVTDFGLVATLRDQFSGSDLGEAEGMDVFGSLTRTGAVVGTPAYMAPEQFAGGVVDARGDQFSYFVALYEALYHTRPFPASTVAELKKALRVPAREPTAAQRRGVPRWLTAAVMRGLALDPAARFPSMDDAVRALSIDRRRTRARVIAASCAGVVLAAGGVTTWIATRPDAAASCTRAAADIAKVWSADRHAPLSSAFAATRAPYAGDVARSAIGALDHYAARWRTSHTAACAATHDAGTQTAAALDLRISCLARRKRALATTVELLSAPTAALLEHAVDVVGALPSLAECDDVAALTGVVPPPADPAQRREIDLVRERLARADALGEAGSLELARPLLDEQVAAAEKLRYAPLEAEALSTRGKLEGAARDLEQAAVTYRAAAASADRGRDDRRRMWAIAKLIGVLAASGKVDEAEAQIPAGQAALERVGAEGELAELWDLTLARIDYLRGRIDAARQRYDAAIAKVRARGDRHMLGEALQERSIGISEVADPAETMPLAEESLAIAKAEYGEAHPETARRETAVARLLMHQGKFADALAMTERAYAVLVAVYGDAHADAAITEGMMGNILRALGRNDEARTRLLHALAKLRARFGDKHYKVADMLLSLGQTEKRAGAFDAAIAYIEEAQHILESTLGPETDGLVATYHTIGMIRRDQGKDAEAEAALVTGLALGEKIAPDNPRLALFTSELGAMRLAAKDPAGAERYLERAVATYSAASTDPEMLAYMRLDLAYAKSQLGKWADALALAEQSRAALLEPDDVKEAETFLAKARKHAH